MSEVVQLAACSTKPLSYMLEKVHRKRGSSGPAGRRPSPVVHDTSKGSAGIRMFTVANCIAEAASLSYIYLEHVVYPTRRSRIGRRPAEERRAEKPGGDRPGTL